MRFGNLARLKPESPVQDCCSHRHNRGLLHICRIGGLCSQLRNCSPPKSKGSCKNKSIRRFILYTISPKSGLLVAGEGAGTYHAVQVAGPF